MTGSRNNTLFEKAASTSVRFLWRGDIVELDDFKPTTTILEFLREHQFAVGTKEGCNEGDCGACTVAIGRPEGGRMQYRAINACIQFLGTLHGAHLITVEDLRNGDGNLHPVQTAMVEKHAAQCGFCTPGFVMSLFVLSHRGDKQPLSRQKITDAVAGNLCRCTGYRPIIDAAFEACDNPGQDDFTENETKIIRKLESIDTVKPLFVGTEEQFFARPSTEDELADIFLKYPNALLVAGGTDVGLWVTKQLREFRQVIYLGAVASLKDCTEKRDGREIGAACTFTEVYDELAKIDPDMGELLHRIGSQQIRNSGTIGGNIANGSPIGDSPPALIALGASIELRMGDRTRWIPLEKFFIEYGKQDRGSGEYVRAIHIPDPGVDEHFRCFKIAKRFDQDISSVLGAMVFKLEKGAITDARIAYGGMAGTPMRASKTEAGLIGTKLSDRPAWQKVVDNLGIDFQPMTDQRASDTYRMQAAKGILTKALLELSTPDAATRLVAIRPEQAGAPADG